VLPIIRGVGQLKILAVLVKSVIDTTIVTQEKKDFFPGPDITRNTGNTRNTMLRKAVPSGIARRFAKPVRRLPRPRSVRIDGRALLVLAQFLGSGPRRPGNGGSILLHRLSLFACSKRSSCQASVDSALESPDNDDLIPKIESTPAGVPG